MANIKDLQRMCKTYGHCVDCPLRRSESCIPNELPYDADELVDKWVAEHPAKTYAMDFFEKFPNAQRRATGIPVPCIEGIYSEFSGKNCSAGECQECWNMEMKEDD